VCANDAQKVYVNVSASIGTLNEAERRVAIAGTFAVGKKAPGNQLRGGCLEPRRSQDVLDKRKIIFHFANFTFVASIITQHL
jgi:hypothetical protein